MDIQYRIHDIVNKVKGGSLKMGYYGCSGGSCSGMRGFLTKKEKVEMLQDYKKQLEMETKGVAERISELESEED